MKQLFKCEFCQETFESEKECRQHEIVCSSEDMVYVAECFYASQTFHENPRYFEMFKETVIVNSEFIERVRPVKENDYEFLDELFQDDAFTDLIPSKFIETIIDDFIMCGEFDEESVSQIIDNEEFMDWYSDKTYYPNDDLVCEIRFRNKYKSEDDLGIAFISVYKIEKSKLSKHDKVDIRLRKWITDNVSR